MTSSQHCGTASLDGGRPLYALLTITLAVVLVLLPGLLLAFATGLRGWAGVACAPLLTFVLVTVAIAGTSVLDLRWTPPTVALIAAAVVLLAAGAARVRAARRPADERPGAPGARHRRAAEGGATAVVAPGQDRWWSLLAVAGVLGGAAIGLVTVLRGTGGLRTPNQGFDALFHVNAVERITETGTADPGIAGTLNGYPEGTSVYPDALHALASLVVQLHGDSLAAINGLMACVPLIAGLGLVALLRSWGLVREAAVVPVVLAATTGYPTDPIWLGPIWVFAFAIAFVPAFLVLLGRALADRTVTATVVLGAAAAALAMLHPSAALAAAVFGVFLLASRWLARRGDLLRDLVVLGPAAVLAAAVTLPLIGKALVDSGGGTIVDWPVAQSPGEAIGELVLYNYGTTYPQLWLAIPAVLGLAVGWRSRPAVRWWYGGTAVFALLCVLAAAYEGRVVQLLTGPWWNDRFRFEALVYLALAVFAAIGLVVLGDAVARVLGRLPGSWRSRTVVPATAGLLAVLALLGVLSQGFYVGQNVERLEIAYVPGGGGSVAPADRAAFAFLREVAGEGPVLNDPNDGSPWMWSLDGVRPVFGAALTDPVSPPLPESRQLLVDGLNCLDSDADVRRAVEELGVRYVYSSNTTIIGIPTTNRGFRDLDSVASLQPVYDRDGAVVYEIRPVPLADRAEDGPCELG